jgi:hypothetical protein
MACALTGSLELLAVLLRCRRDLGHPHPHVQRRRGSLLVAVLFHAQMNGPAWPDAQPWDMLGLVVVALVVVLLHHRTLPDRDSGATEVLLPLHPRRSMRDA